MIDVAAARTKLADILAGIDGVSVVRAGIDAVPEFPAVVIGQPDWTEAQLTLDEFERSTFPIAVVVRRSGSDTDDIDQLDQLWPQVIETLRAAIKTDPTLTGTADAAVIVRARYGPFPIQGTNYPAQLITLDLYG